MNLRLIELVCALLLWAQFSSGQTTLTPPAATIPESFFGMHIHHMVSPNGNTPLTPWPSVPVPEWRLWDARVTWPDLEPAKGTWRFDNLDKSLDLAEAHGTNVMLTLGLTPQWASARPNEPSGYSPGNAAEPKDIEDWRTFVRTVATRYKGRIHTYEVGNEPNLKYYWTGTVDQMLAEVREASTIIKGIDPSATIVSPPATTMGGVAWLSEFLSKGGGQYVDVIGYHFYVTPNEPETMLTMVDKVKQVMAANQVGNKPLWDTEEGWSSPTRFASPDLAAAFVIRTYVLLWAEGVQRFYWYSWDNHNLAVQMTASDNRTLTDAGQAYRVMQEWLVGARVDWCNMDSGHTWQCELSRGTSLQWIVWNPDSTKTWTVPTSWRAASIVALLQQNHPLGALSIQVGPGPQLLTQASGPAPPTGLLANPK